MPDTVLPLQALSQKDRADLEFLCQLGTDWIALSFVQRPEDIQEARELIDKRAKLVAKIEKPAAINCIDAIIECSDALMVARGDLGVELPLAKVPLLQKLIVKKCHAVGKPVIVATQMLESMIGSPVPTRAEISDVATAILDGADVVMLSAETAAGAYPIEAVATMVSVAEEVETDEAYLEAMSRTDRIKAASIADMIPSAVRELASSEEIKAVCCFTETGATAIRVAKVRPRAPIIALTPRLETARALTLVWGLSCLQKSSVDRFKGAVYAAIEGAQELGFAEGADKIVVTAGVPMNTEGTTNILRIATIDGSDIV